MPLTHEHLQEWYGESGRAPTVKGVAGFVDGELVAVAGFALTAGKVVAFCELKEEARPYKTAIHRTAVRLFKDAMRYHRRILAYCDENEPTAPAWLRRLGFEAQEDGVWVWRA